MGREGHDTTRRESTPLIVRLSGLPASSLEPSNPDLAKELDRRAQLLAELAIVRDEMVQHLYEVIPEVPKGSRRLVLRAKRDCFNGRALTTGPHSLVDQLLHLGPPSPVDGLLLRRLLDLERALESWRKGFAAIYRAARWADRRRLLELAAEPRLLRGLALASPSTAANLHRLDLQIPGEVSSEGEGSSRKPSRRQRRLEQTLLRFASRAALKLTPYSTLTRVGIGMARSAGGGPTLTGWPWREHSLLRCRPYVLEQFHSLLLHHEQYRLHCHIGLNPSLQEIAPGQYSYLRQARWRLEDEPTELVFEPAALVRGRLSGPVVSGSQRCLAVGPRSFKALSEALAKELDLPREPLAEEIDRLTEIGFLCWLVPQAGDIGTLEQGSFERLSSLPAAAGLDPLRDLLGRLVDFEKDYASSSNFAAAQRAMTELLEETWSQLLRLLDLPAALQRPQPAGSELFEDVVMSGQGEAEGEILNVGRRGLEQALVSAEPWLRLANLSSHRYEFQHTVADFLARSGAGVAKLGVLELFSALRPLWRSFLRFLASPPEAGAVFNPSGLAEIEDLARLRRDVEMDLVELLRNSTDGVLEEAALERLCAAIPETYTPPLGACLFLQPADKGGERWVLNRLFEGSGRYGSRFTCTMDRDARRRYTRHLIERSTGFGNTGETELLDLFCLQGDSLNLHARQTRAMLHLPGEQIPAEAQRPVALAELRFGLDRHGLPCLQDRSGRPFLPVHLGGTAMDYLPPLVRFLALFGSGELQPLQLPALMTSEKGGVETRKRLCCGNLVIRRRAWKFSAQQLERRLDGRSETEAFAELDRWRREVDLPDRGFLIEPVRFGGAHKAYKPQYIDFRNPLFVSLFRTCLASGEEWYTLEEMLPRIEDLPTDSDDRPWAVELQVDSLLLRPRSERQHDL